MRRSPLAGLVAGALGCTQSAVHTRVVPRDTEVRTARLPGTPTGIGGTWQRTADTLAGRLHREAACQVTHVVHRREETVEVSTPTEGNTAAIVFGGLLLVPGGLALGSALAAAPSDHPDSGHDLNFGPLGAGLVGMGLLFLTFGALTRSEGPRQTRLQARELPPEVRTFPGRALCGSGPVAGLGLAVHHRGQRIATGTSDGRSEVAFTLPPDLGELTVVVTEVPVLLQDYSAAGDVVGVIPP